MSADRQVVENLAVRNMNKKLDRDIKAAKKIADEGLRLLAGGHLATASGERVRPSKGTALTRHFSVKEESPHF